jgi:hypothetical protein
LRHGAPGGQADFQGADGLLNIPFVNPMKRTWIEASDIL